MRNDAQVVILAGGLGTRLAARTNGAPKPMATLVNSSIIQHQIRHCISLGFTSFAILSSYKSELLRYHIESMALHNVTIEFFVEDIAEGTAGALLRFAPLLQETILVLYGDTYLTVDLREFLNSHLRISGSEDFLATLLVHPNSHPHDSDLIVLDEDDWIKEIIPYPHPEGKIYRNLVNAALYAINTRALEKQNLKHLQKEKTDIAKDLFPNAIKNGYLLKAIHNRWFIKDCGTPERLDSVADLLSNSRAELTNMNARGVVFIDRDGCLNEEIGHITKPEQLKLLPEVAVGVQILNKHNIPVICVTNQPVIARGDATEDDLNQIHAKLEYELAKEGAFLNDILYCPHHPDSGFVGEIGELKIDCSCRKPNVGMAFEASKKFKIDFSKSWMIGDTTSDIQFGKNLGMNTVLLRTGHCGRDRRENAIPDFIFDDVAQASNFIAIEHPKILKFVKSEISELVNNPLIFVGGKSQAGKSTIANILRKCLSDLGEDVLVIPADHWLTVSKHRSASADVEQVNSVKNFNDSILQLTQGQRPIYQSINQKLEFDNTVFQQPIKILNRTKLIIEGFATAFIDPAIIAEGFFIWVDVDEVVRKRRFLKKYEGSIQAEGDIVKHYKDILFYEETVLTHPRQLADVEWNIE